MTIQLGDRMPLELWVSHLEIMYFFRLKNGILQVNQHQPRAQFENLLSDFDLIDPNKEFLFNCTRLFGLG